MTAPKPFLSGLLVGASVTLVAGLALSMNKNEKTSGKKIAETIIEHIEASVRPRISVRGKASSAR